MRGRCSRTAPSPQTAQHKVPTKTKGTVFLSPNQVVVEVRKAVIPHEKNFERNKTRIFEEFFHEKDARNNYIWK
jgi:hypothetical protein